MIPEEASPLLFAYKSPNRFDGACRLQYLNLEDGRVAVLTEQIAGNPGMSITNAVEHIAVQVCDQLAIHPKRLVLIQHYDIQLMQDPDWSRVTFDGAKPDQPFQEPRWESMSAADWRSLGIKPPPRRTKRAAPTAPFILKRIPRS